MVVIQAPAKLETKSCRDTCLATLCMNSPIYTVGVMSHQPVVRLLKLRIILRRNRIFQ